MELSEILNLVLGGGLVATIVAIVTLRSTVRKAKAEAVKAEADAETIRIDNAEHATRVLVENIVKPLKEELNETKKELARNTREMARLRKALNSANSCDYRDDCPVLYSLRDPKERDAGEQQGNVVAHRQRGGKREPKRDAGDSADERSDADTEPGQPL